MAIPRYYIIYEGSIQSTEGPLCYGFLQEIDNGGGPTADVIDTKTNTKYTHSGIWVPIEDEETTLDFPDTEVEYKKLVNSNMDPSQLVDGYYS